NPWRGDRGSGSSLVATDLDRLGISVTAQLSLRFGKPKAAVPKGSRIVILGNFGNTCNNYLVMLPFDKE
ncbi:MAG: hypothetical protein ABI395_13080, partial [Sphingobium sp.]